MFQKSKNIAIHGGTFINVTNLPKKELSALERLQERASHGAFHNSSERYDPPKCHPHTRLSVLKDIMDWIGIEDDQRTSFILWLYGPAGAGKSAIAQTIAEICYELGILAASFFWSRSAPGRNNEERLVATLAYQLLIAIPQLAIDVDAALENDRLLLSRNLEVQMESLIVEPLRKASLLGLEMPVDPGSLKILPRLIILDGLDECGTPNIQRYILKAISTAVRRSSIPILFLIASRSEQEIRDGFNAQPLSSITTRLALDDTYHPNDDIRRFLVDSFNSLKESHPLRSRLPPTWPTANEIEAIVQKSSGQFVYAATIVKFVVSPRHRPQDRLKIIFRVGDTGNHTPFANLDALYCRIFSSVMEEDLPRALEIFSCIFLLSKSRLKTVDMIEDILSYEHGDLYIILSDLYSVVDVPADSGSVLVAFHASLEDFLMDPTRSGRFYIDGAKARSHLTQCFRHVFLVNSVFNIQALVYGTTRPALDEGCQPDEDIRLFLAESFKNIRETHPLTSYIPESWPTADEIETIVRKSAGQFVYAATVVKFVNSLRYRPDCQLSIVLRIGDTGNCTPFAELDALYRYIFSRVENLPQVLEIFSCLFLLSKSELKTAYMIGEILSYRRGEVQMILTDLHPVVNVRGSRQEVRVWHASLQDFLLDPTRSGQFYIDVDKARTQLTQCFQRAFLV